MASKNSPEVARLLEEFKAEDHGVELVVIKGFERVVAAKYSEGNDCWELTQGGKDLLNPPDESAEVTPPPTVKMPGAKPGATNIDVKVKKA